MKKQFFTRGVKVDTQGVNVMFVKNLNTMKFVFELEILFFCLPGANNPLRRSFRVLPILLYL